MRAATEDDYRERILRVLVHIQNHLDEVLHYEALARLAHFSSYHFHRVFRGMVGETVQEHVRRLRLERATHRLRFSDQPIVRIAFEAGFETHESFTRAFSARFGVSPSQFRARNRALTFPAAPCNVHFLADGKLTTFQPLHSGAQLMEVRIETVPARRVAFMRHLGPYQDVGSTWQKLAAWAGPRGLLTAETVAIGVAHDDPDITPADRNRYDACLTVDPSFQPEGDVGVQEVGGGEYAITTHRGPYRDVGQTILPVFGQWLPASGREPRSAPMLFIPRGLWVGVAQEDLQTDVCVPLE